MNYEIIKTGEKPGNGTYYCTNCAQEITVGEYDKVPPCPKCGNNEFTENKKEEYPNQTLS